MKSNKTEPQNENQKPDGQVFSIAGHDIAVEEQSRFEIPVARLVTGTWLSLPVTVLNGRFAGPTLCLSAALHGDELNGFEIIRRVLEKISLPNLHGTVVAVPIVNVYGFVEQSRYTPDRRDLNRSFPGSAKGSLAAQLAYMFLNDVVYRCDYGIDLHTGSNHRTNLPQIRADLEREETLKLAAVFGAPVMLHAKTIKGTLRAAAKEKKMPMLLYEAGETHRFNEDAIAVGVVGVLNVMDALKMRPSNSKGDSTTIRSDNSRWLRASQSGVFYQSVKLGEEVKAGQTVGIITDTFGDTKRRIRCPMDGLVIGHVTNPMVHRGEAVMHIAAT